MMSILGSIGEFIGGIFNVIWACLCVPIYFNIARFFNLFITIAELDILSDANMNEIYKRVTMIITIIMSFYVVFSIVKYTISPDTVGDKEKGAGKIVYRMIIVILLIAFVPEMFSMAYKIQNRLISTQVFSKVILGHEAIDYSTYGNSFAADTFSAFYRVDYKNCGNSCDAAQEHVSDVIESIRSGKGGTLNIISAIGGQIGWSVSGHIVDAETVEFDGLLALIFGCFTLYVIFLYCIDVAVRYVQMLYLQIIAPIAITGYVVPSKDNMFQKWWKQCLTTYLDLFIRISIMYFAMLIIQILGHSLNITQMTSNGNNLHFQFPIFNDGTGALRVYIFFVMGVLIFMQRAPKLISELFPKGGAAGIGFGLEWKTRGEPLKKSIDTIKKPIAATAGAVASTVSTVKSLRNGKLKTALNEKFGKNKGWKKNLNSAYILGKSAFGGGKDAAKRNSIFGAITNRDKQEQAATNLLNNGGSPLEHDLRGLHFENLKADFKKYLDDLDAVVKSRKTAKDSGSELKINKAAQSIIADWNEKGLGDPTARTQFGKDIEKLMNVYARNNNKNRAELSIDAAVDSTGIYTFDEGKFRTKLNAEGVTNEVEIVTRMNAERERLAAEKQNTIDILKQQLGKDEGSVELSILRENLNETEKIARFTKNATDFKFEDILPDGSHVPHKFKVKDVDNDGNLVLGTDGKPKEVYKTLDELRPDQFAEIIGDIEKMASEEIVKTKYSPEYKEANANANVPGKKDGDK